MGRIADFLETKASEIEAPKIPPVGDYILSVKKVPVMGEIKGADGAVRFEKLTFPCQLEAASAVDEDDLAEYGANVKGYPVRVEFLLDVNAEDQDHADNTFQNRVKEFLVSKLACMTEEMTLQQGFAAAPGMVFGGLARHRAAGEQVFFEIERTYPID